MSKILVLLAALGFIAIPALANDTAFGGEGAAPIPIKQNNVFMLNEHIIITGNDITRDDMKGEWKITCDYNFKNAANFPLFFKMGFPFPTNDEDGEITVPEGYTATKGGALVHGFEVTVDGKPVSAKKQKIKPIPDEDLNYQVAYIWPIKMQPDQTINIKHNYITGVTVNSVGQSYVHFVLKTGGLWKGGKIDSSILEIIPNTPTKMCYELDKTADYLIPKPPGVIASGFGKDRTYRWDLKDFQPKDDLELCLITGKNYVRYFIVYPILQITGYNNATIDLNQMLPRDLQILRNTIYAQYGRQFEDPSLQAYFSKQWWYQPNPNYSDQLLTQEDKKAIATITAQENKT